MKKHIFLAAAISLFSTMAIQAQVSSGPEVPRNYKPTPKPLLPMPGELTDEMIFPALGSYEITFKDGTTSSVTIRRDSANKGMVWVSGFPQGKFKAALRASPGTYKIPSQVTLKNDAGGLAESDDAAIEKKSSGKKTVKSIGEGTMIYDKENNKLYVNLGSKFDEDNPSKVFAEMMAPVESADVAAPETSSKTKKNKKAKISGINYTGMKILTGVAPADSIH